LTVQHHPWGADIPGFAAPGIAVEPLRAAQHLSNQEKTKVGPPAADTPRMSPISGSVSSVSLPSAQDSGLAALATSSGQLSQDAQQIANPANENQTGPLLDSSQSLLLTQAGADVIRASNQMLGTLLDVFA
jgi:hypothetical protein